MGTQYGTISIFNVAALTVPGADPLLTTFTTSRPNAEHGAVRDMAFSPGPVDLLAWTEDRGRVGVADIRTGFDSRQILYLDREDDFEHVDVTDRSTIDPRLLEQRNDRAETILSNLAETLENRQGGQSEGQEPLGRYNLPLNQEETAVLEAIQDHRRRQEQYNSTSTRTGTESGGNGNSNGGSGSGNGSGSGTGTGTRSPWAERAARSTLTPDGARPRERTASVSRAVNEILDTIRDQRERNRDGQERLRTRGDEYTTTERRRYATLSGRTSGPAFGTGSSERRALISRLMSNANPASSGSWDNVEALYDDPSSNSGDPPPPPPPDQSTSAVLTHSFRIFADAQRRLHRAAYLMRDWDENPSRRIFGSYMSHIRPGPYDTAGLAWNESGDFLLAKAPVVMRDTRRLLMLSSRFVGAENGIYEFRVNVFGRRLSPSITLS